jgi:hypothetical protein
MSTTTEFGTGIVEHRPAVVNELAILALFSALGLLASLYVMTHFPLPVEDATFLTTWL